MIIKCSLTLYLCYWWGRGNSALPWAGCIQDLLDWKDFALSLCLSSRDKFDPFREIEFEPHDWCSNNFQFHRLSFRPKERTLHSYCKDLVQIKKSWVLVQILIAPFLALMPLLQSLVSQACKQGIQSKAGAIKCCKETKITAPPKGGYSKHPLLILGNRLSQF